MNTYKVYCPKVAGSGFVIYLVCADTEIEALAEVRKVAPHYDIGRTVEKINLYNDKNYCIVEIINYDNPTYEG